MQRWLKKFRDEDESFEDEEGCGRPLAVGNVELRRLVEVNSCTTARQLADKLSISHSMILDHLNHLGKSKSSING